MKDKNKIPKDILPYFIEIAKRLWSGHATIMIGAGFSENAKKSESTKKSFPDWNKLGDVFYKKIHGTYPTDKRYLNVSKLADEVQAAFGRNTLDRILKTEIPDKEYQPSLLHEKTLQLPWTDVFTTNYDTLLERTAERILQHRYETVINKEDLVFSAKPRIIKLHGSFPSKRPFIITEEDYRQYPKEFAPFVNTVQQSLLENTLCLLGFSSYDPNFLQWIGWIRDNLGKENSPKIYLIGILSLSIAQKKLLEQRNIIPLDLSDCKSIHGSHKKALSLFIGFLHEQGKVEESLGWPEKNEVFHFNHDQNVTPRIPPIIENWRSIRIKYPNWLIVPEDRRDALQSYTEISIPFVYHLSKVKAPIDIEFLYEFNWRIEKCLIPIYNDLIEHYENVIYRYNPFPNLIEIENTIKPDSKNKNGIDWKEITFMWLEIQLSMMRFYREEGFYEKWELIKDRLSKLIDKLDPELIARYYYERCLYYLFALNISLVRKELDSWTTDVSLPYWEAKKAGLLAELGDVLDAEKILETSLKSIRSLLNLSPIVNDYKNVSQEAYVLQLLKYLKDSKNLVFDSSTSYEEEKTVSRKVENGTIFPPKSYTIKGSDKHEESFEERKERASEYKKKWDELKFKYKCDPWAELKSFKIYLEKKLTDLKRTEKKYGFDIGSVSTSHKLGTYDKYVQKAYSYLRYIEEIGIPYHLGNTTFGKEAAEGAITLIVNYSPYWSFASYVRLGNTKSIDSIFGRKSLSRMDRESVDKLIKKYLSVLESSKSEIKNGDTFRNSNFAISLSTVIPEILSRLCVKSSHNIKMRLLEFLKFAFDSEFRDRYKGIANLTKRLINSLSESVQYEIIPILIEFPILPELNHIVEREYIDPFEFIDINKNVLEKVKRIEVEDEKICKLFEIGNRAAKERKFAIRRLVQLWDLECLSKNQTDQLGELLWSKTDIKTGFPIETNYYNFVFIKLPHPKNISPEQLLKAYISTFKFPLQANKKGKGISMTGGEIQLFREINGTANTDINYTWTKEDISLLVKNVIEWWDADKKHLENDKDRLFGSISEEFRARFRHLISIFSDILSPNYQFIEESERLELHRITDELEKLNMPYVEAKASFYRLIPDKQNEIYSTIFKNLFTKSKNKVIDALRGFLKLLKLSVENITNLIQVISENIRGLNNIELDRFIEVITLVVKNHPELLNDKILNDLEMGLTNLISETIISSQDSDKIVNDKLSYKREAAHLTVALSTYYKSKEKNIPDYIVQWEKVCSDPNEFSEIRRIWKDK